MDYYIASELARQWTQQVARDAERSHLRRQVPRTRARWHFPKVSWHLPTLHTAGA